MNIYILCKGQLEAQPPIMSLAIVLQELGHEVKIVTSFSAHKTKLEFGKNKIIVKDLFENDIIFSRNIFSKFLDWKVFARRAWRYIDSQKEDKLLWVGTADTALAIGNKLLSKKYVLNIFELYDTFPLYKFMLARYARNAKIVVVPEFCRASIFRSWYGLSKTPIVLPNKAEGHPRNRRLSIEDDNAKDILSKMRPENKIVLYQGHVERERDVRSVGKAVEELGEGWRFVVMGPVHGEYLNILKKYCPSLIYIPRLIAPSHLQITSYAHVGVVTYSWDKLNHVFCAPNKIWEYAGFGVPMICAELPALQISVGAKNAGVCVDMENSNEIKSALLYIDKNYEIFHSASKSFYDSVDTKNIIREIANTIL